MGAQYGRTATLTVGSLSVESEGELGLRVAFQISKSVKIAENSARIRIYNLSKDTRSRLTEEASKVGQQGVIRRVVLEAGYGDVRRQLFSGDKAWISHRHEGTDWITTVESMDGLAALGTQVNVSFAPGVLGKDVVERVAKDVGLAIEQAKSGQFKKALETIVYSSGKALTGSARQAITEVAGDAGLEVSVQDGALLFHVPDGESPNTGLVLTANTGLVGTPEPFIDPARKTKPDTNPQIKNLVRGRALLNGLLAPGRRFKLDSVSSDGNAGATTGLFRALKVEHVGDTHGGDESWLTTWEAEEVAS